MMTKKAITVLSGGLDSCVATVKKWVLPTKLLTCLGLIK